MTLALTFAAILLVITAMLWLMSAVIQPFFYTEIVPALGVRALICGAALAAFLSFWATVNARASHRDKYGTFFEFTPTAIEDVTRFDAVRRLAAKGADGNLKEETVAFVRASGTGGRVEFVEAKNPNAKYAVNSSSYMTVALLIPPPGGGDPVRYEAELDRTGRAYRTPARLFRQVNGPRTLEGEYPGSVAHPDRLALLAALALNFGHFALWFAAFALVLRYDAGTSIGLAAAFGLLTMLAVMPLLFQQLTPPTGPPPIPVAAGAGA